ncbi:Protein sel-1-like protein 1 [Phytophthora ramorum]|nr:Protein sel-1-like protein 1 [Phytophthora ramorum]
MRRFGRRVAAAAVRRSVANNGRALLKLQRSQSLAARAFSSAVSENDAYEAFEKAKKLLDGDDLQQAMGYLGVAAHADIADAQYLLGSLLLNDGDDDEEDEDEAQRKNKELIRDAEANRQRSSRPDDAQNIKEIRKSARAAYKQYLMEQKRKKQAKAARSDDAASLVQHATTGELDRAFGKTVELLLDPKAKLQPLLENADDHSDEGAAKMQLDTTKAVEWLRRAADNHNRDAHVQLGNLCLSHDPPMALEASAWYSNVTKNENPHPDALYNLGVMLFNGVDHAEPAFTGNKSASIPFFTRAAEVGDISAQFFMGMLLHQGDKDLGIEPSFQSGLMLIEMAASKGHPGALFYLAQLYRSGDEANKLAEDRAKFFEYLDKAMEVGDADAYFCMADIYFHGSDGFEQDYEQAHGFYMAAAEQGHADAFCCLGALYYNAIGVEKDYEKAFLYYQEAADRDSMEAWKNLAEMYTLGRGVPRNEATANAIVKMLKKVQTDVEKNA